MKIIPDLAQQHRRHLVERDLRAVSRPATLARAHEFGCKQRHGAIFFRQRRSRELDRGVDPDTGEGLDVLREPAAILGLRALIAELLRRAAQLERLDDVAGAVLDGGANGAGEHRAVDLVEERYDLVVGEMLFPGFTLFAR